MNNYPIYFVCLLNSILFLVVMTLLNIVLVKEDLYSLKLQLDRIESRQEAKNE